MDAYSNRLSKALEEALNAKAAELTKYLASTPAVDYAAYMERVGRVRGIEIALGELRELEAKLSAPEVRVTSDMNVKMTRYED
jgi:hypothetical protein